VKGEQAYALEEKYTKYNELENFTGKVAARRGFAS